MKYKSKLEVKVAKWLKQHKVRFKYESTMLPYRQRILHARCDSCKSTHVSRSRNYLPDFTLASGFILEAKGILDTAQRQKFIALKEEGYDFALVFQSNNKISKDSDTRYLEWCARYEIPACVFPKIPEEWLK